jgi:hypothetical protein
MEYVQHVLDRKSGELIEVSAGNWITITEIGIAKGVSPRRIRTILREMGFLYVEGGRAHNRHRLMPWVIQQGYGKHVPARKPSVRYPFDVISPAGQAWIEARWSDTVRALEAKPYRPEVVQAREALANFEGRRLGELDIHGRVLWLLDHFKDSLSHTEIAGILDVTQQLVSRYARLHEAQKRSKELRKSAELPDMGKVRFSRYEEDETMASGGAEVYYPSPQHAEKCNGNVSDRVQRPPASSMSIQIGPESLAQAREAKQVGSKLAESPRTRP